MANFTTLTKRFENRFSRASSLDFICIGQGNNYFCPSLYSNYAAMIDSAQEFYRKEYAAWETLPIEEHIMQIGNYDHRTLAYALEQSIANATGIPQPEVRELLLAAANDGFLKQDGEWIAVAPEHRYKHITTWEGES